MSILFQQLSFLFICKLQEVDYLQQLSRLKMNSAVQWQVYQISDSMQKVNSLHKDVPIYTLEKHKASFKAQISHKKDAYYARGTLVGNFYTLEEPVILHDVKFVGQFKGTLDKTYSSADSIYFEGAITHFLIFKDRSHNLHEYNGNVNDPSVIEELQQTQTNFKGFFKGCLHKWEAVTSLKEIPLNDKKVVEIEQELSIHKQQKNCNRELIRKLQGQEFQTFKKKKEPEYFLPTVVRFQIEEIRSINLQKSSAIISGTFYIEIHYNDRVKELIDLTNRKLNQLKEDAQGQAEDSKKMHAMRKYQNLLLLQLGFQRDYNITLSFKEEDDEGGNESEGSEWSIVDKTWDIMSQINQKEKTFIFKVWKCYNTQIDNSYGSFFAPFNLSVLRIVMTLHYFNVLNQNNENVKINLIGTDVLDYDPDSSLGGYNPFKPFNDLQKHRAKGNQTFMPHVNRVHKINRFHCKDNHQYHIADNRLTLYPHYRNILLNKNTANQNYKWTMGTQQKLPLINEPEVMSVYEGYSYYYDKFIERKNGIQEEKSQLKVDTFKFHKWNFIIIEVPIYKYVVIDMLQVFVPLTLLAAFSLLIFEIQNGISPGTGFTTLAYRIVHVSELMIAYVSLIPIIRQSLPPMPGFTLVELIAYTLTIPNFLALLNSMLSYTIPMAQWQANYFAFRNATFLIAFVMVMIVLSIMGALFITYINLSYKLKKKLDLPPPEERIYRYRSPNYINFMEKVRNKRHECRIKGE